VEVIASMPTLDERLALAEQTLTALARPGASELPAKIAVHPRPTGSFVHAMPAHLRADSATSDLVGLKWVAGFATNNALGLPSISAVMIVNDPETGVPIAMLDGGPITAQRTAAVTGVALRHFGPGAGRESSPEGDAAPGEPTHVAIVGAGTQGRSHLPVVGAVLPGSALHLFDRHEERTSALAELARTTAGIASVEVHTSAREAVEAADVVITVATLLVVPTFYDSIEIARDRAIAKFRRRSERRNPFFAFILTFGEAILASTGRPPGRVVVTHLGVGLADLVFADAIVRAAIADGRGTTLRR